MLSIKRNEERELHFVSRKESNFLPIVVFFWMVKKKKIGDKQLGRQKIMEDLWKRDPEKTVLWIIRIG